MMMMKRSKGWSLKIKKKKNNQKKKTLTKAQYTFSVSFFTLPLMIMGFQWTFRLRLIHVKYFPENKYFLEMLFSGNENIFKCLVAFQKMF